MPLTVDLVDGTGDQAVADDVTRHLTAGGLTVGTTSPAGGPVTSAIRFPESERAQAQQLADALGRSDLLQPADVEHVTVVLGTEDSGALVEAVDRFTGLPCADDPADG